MSTDSPADKPKLRRRPTWRRRFLILFLGLVLGILAAGYVATRNLVFFARWALERAFPGATVEIRKLDLAYPNRLVAESITLKSRKDGATLLTLGGGSVAFSIDDIWNRRVGEVKLLEPVINASPRLTEAFVRPPGPAPAKTAGVPWTVRRLTCDYGHLNISEYGSPGIKVSTKFSFDFHNFSPAAASTIHQVTLWDLTAAVHGDPAFLTLSVVKASFSFEHLFGQRTFTTSEINGGSLIVGKSLREIFSASNGLASPNPDPVEPAQPWVLGTLDIRRVTVRLDDERPEVNDITFALNTTLKNIPVSQMSSSLGSESQKIAIRRVDILSPHDAQAKVFTIHVIHLHFTLAGLLRREIEDLTIERPVIYVGPELFWYMDDLQKRYGLTADMNTPSPGKPGAKIPGWSIKRLFIVKGEVVVGSSGRRQYGLPLNFWANATDVAFDNLASLKLETAMEIPVKEYTFADYQLEFTGGGKMHFSYPPEKGERNLVGDITLSAIRWRQYKASNAFVAVTFDKKGINGKFGGKAYRGSAGGGFSFFFENETPWIGWVYGKGIDLKQLTDVIAPQNFQMTGPLDFRLQMDAVGRDIRRVAGDIQAPRPGKMVISKLDDMLRNIPPEWNSLKKGSMKIMLETLRDFDYTSGDGRFWFVRAQGILRLKLQGPNGSRNFEVVLHADDSPLGRWKERSANR